ncbi:hypothetical protein D3C76_1534190 [compost metagenome]
MGESGITGFCKIILPFVLQHSGPIGFSDSYRMILRTGVYDYELVSSGDTLETGWQQRGFIADNQMNSNCRSVHEASSLAGKIMVSAAISRLCPAYVSGERLPAEEKST